MWYNIRTKVRENVLFNLHSYMNCTSPPYIHTKFTSHLDSLLSLWSV